MYRGGKFGIDLIAAAIGISRVDVLFSDGGREYTILYQADGEGKLDRRGDAVPDFCRTHLLCRVHNCDDGADDPGFLFREWMEYPGYRLR